MSDAGSGSCHDIVSGLYEETAAYSFADEIVRQAEIVGSTDVSGRIAQLKQETGLDPQIQWDCDYYSGNKVQLNGDIQVTLTQRVDIGFFVFGSFPIELKARASGKSEVYYK